PVEEVRFEVDLGSDSVLVPPIGLPALTIPPATIARWPLRLEVGGATVEWATASALTVIHGEVPTLVLVAEAGIPAMVSVRTDVAAAPVLIEADTDAEDPALHRLHVGQAALDVLVLAAAWAAELWVLDAPSGERMLLRSSAPVWLEGDELAVRAEREPRVQRYSMERRSFSDVRFSGVETERLPVRSGLVRWDPRAAQASFGGTAARRAAPHPDDIERLATVIPLEGLGAPTSNARRTMLIEWAGDVATLDVAGRTVADRFWDGTPWLIDLDALGLDSESDVTLRILQLHPDSEVHLPAEAEGRRRSHDGPLGSLDRLVVHRTTIWHGEVLPFDDVSPRPDGHG
ncbi:MAG TPA: hypothetical protein VI121_02665, partial [Agromyces sp.]